MQIKISLLPSMLIGYLLGCYFTPYMFFDMQITQWTNLFTWCWIFLWPAALVIHLILWFLISGAWLVCLLLGFGFVVLVAFLDG